MKRLLLFSTLAVALGLPMTGLGAEHDAPVIMSRAQGFAKVVITLNMGPSGAPAGFTVMWMEESDFLANDSQWYSASNDVQKFASFTGVPTLNTWGGTLTSFSVGAQASVTVEIGDLFDETGVTTNWSDELVPGTRYVFVAFVNGDGVLNDSPLSNVVHASTQGNQDCTYTQGFWKNHPQTWPVSALTLGTVLYDQGQLLSILNEPVQGNGLVSMSHQLIAVELNIANGATPDDVQVARTEAHNLTDGLVIPPIGSGFLHPSVTSSTTQTLDDFNNGIVGPGHCSVAVEPTTWGTVKSSYR